MASAQVEFATAPDGVQIACASVGEGLPVIMMPAWISTVKGALGRLPDDPSDYYGVPARFIAMDKRGTGLSGDDIGDYTVETRARDIEAVVEHFGLTQFVLAGGSEAVAMSIRYAVDQPGRVLAMVLLGGYAHGDLRPPDVQDAILRAIRAEWGMGAEFLNNLFMPGATPEEAEGFRLMQVNGASAENAALLWQSMPKMDVSDILEQVACPTLIGHARGDRVIPFEYGLELARRIPGARLITFESGYHGLTADEQIRWRANVGEFLSETASTRAWFEGYTSATQDGLQTILFTDLAGSTAMQSRLGDQAAHEVVRTHDAAMRQAIEEFNGREVKHTGDGMMAAFGSAADAVNCALAVKRDIATYNDTHEGEELLVRFGLNAGEPIAEDDDLFGLSVTLAARIGDWGEPGQVLVSDVVRQLLLGKGFEFTSVGSAELKGLDEPVPLFEVAT